MPYFYQGTVTDISETTVGNLAEKRQKVTFTTIHYNSPQQIMEQPLSGKRVAVLVETEFIPAEIDCYQTRFPGLGAQVDLLTYLWGKPQRELICDIDNPEKPTKDLRTF